VPERWLSDDEAHGILNELDALAAAGQERGS
jgi:hypothetical protein